MPTPDTFKWVHCDTPEQLHAFYTAILPKLRDAACQHGFALGLHGSMRRDLDLIAVPWVLSHSDKDALAAALQMAACGMSQDVYRWTGAPDGHDAKPHGRVACSFPVCWADDNRPSSGHIDLSVVGLKEST